MDPARRRNVGIIAADRDANVAVAAEQIVGGIEFHPAGFAEIGFHPCVRRAGGRAILALALVIEVTADVAARNVQAGAPARS